jgi:hypothetical protein
MERKLSLEECGSAAGIQVIIDEVGKAGGGKSCCPRWNWCWIAG